MSGNARPINRLGVPSPEDGIAGEGGRWQVRWTFATLVVVLLICLSCSRFSASEEIPVVAYILNAQPEVVELRIGEGDTGRYNVDPGSKFTIEVKVRDNNTIGDVTRLRVVLYSPSVGESSLDGEVHHYTFGWTSSAGFANQGGVGDLFTSECSAPSDTTSATGTWVFVARPGSPFRARREASSKPIRTRF